MATVVPNTSFVHGQYDAHEGKPMLMEDSIANELEQVGLVRIRKAPPISTQAPPSGKAQDDGQGQPSSFSPEAPVSRPTPTPTLRPSGSGGIRTPRRGR
jgi:hypothetical protein